MNTNTTHRTQLPCPARARAGAAAARGARPRRELTVLSDLPIAAKVTAKPNILYTLDDSGSMVNTISRTR